MSASRKKKYQLKPEQIEPIAKGYGAGIASDQILCDGYPVGYMYREEPLNDDDSGWRFFSGFEEDKDMSNAAYFAFYDINTIANYDTEIIPFLDSPVGSEFARDEEDGELREILENGLNIHL